MSLSNEYDPAHGMDYIFKRLSENTTAKQVEEAPVMERATLVSLVSGFCAFLLLSALAYGVVAQCSAGDFVCINFP